MWLKNACVIKKIPINEQHACRPDGDLSDQYACDGLGPVDDLFLQPQEAVQDGAH